MTCIRLETVFILYFVCVFINLINYKLKSIKQSEMFKIENKHLKNHFMLKSFLSLFLQSSFDYYLPYTFFNIFREYLIYTCDCDKQMQCVGQGGVMAGESDGVCARPPPQSAPHAAAVSSQRTAHLYQPSLYFYYTRHYFQ